jgi:hypothetical protein
MEPPRNLDDVKRIQSRCHFISYNTICSHSSVFIIIIVKTNRICEWFSTNNDGLCLFQFVKLHFPETPSELRLLLVWPASSDNPVYIQQNTPLSEQLRVPFTPDIMPRAICLLK